MYYQSYCTVEVIMQRAENSPFKLLLVPTVCPKASLRPSLESGNAGLEWGLAYLSFGHIAAIIRYPSGCWVKAQGLSIVVQPRVSSLPPLTT